MTFLLAGSVVAYAADLDTPEQEIEVEGVSVTGKTIALSAYGGVTYGVSGRKYLNVDAARIWVAGATVLSSSYPAYFRLVTNDTYHNTASNVVTFTSTSTSNFQTMNYVSSGSSYWILWG